MYFTGLKKILIVDNFLKLLDCSLSSMYIRGCYLSWYTLNNIGSLEGTLQYYQHAITGELWWHGDCTEGFFLKNLHCLECR